MKAVIIIYDGLEVPDHMLNEIVATHLQQLVTGNVSALRLSDKEVAIALLNAEHSKEESSPSDQEAIDAAATYLTEKVLNYFNTPTSIAYAIGRYISCGDTEMRTAVEILATKKGLIKEPKLTKPVLNAIKSVYEGMKHFG